MRQLFLAGMMVMILAMAGMAAAQDAPAPTPVPAVTMPAQPSADISPVLLQPFDARGTVGPVLKGLTLSLHPKLTTPNKTLQWLAQHGTLEIPCVGESWDELKAGVGVALNFGTQEGISIKAGLAYISAVKKPAVMVGIKFPLG